MVTLKGSNFILREWEESDAEELARIGNNKKIAQNMVDTFPFPYTIDSAEYWVCNAGRGENKANLAIEVDGKLAGGIGFSIKDGLHEGVANGGYWLGEEFWGNGIGTEAWALIRDYIFENYDVHRVEASVFSWNPASARVQEKCGFKLEGTLRQNSKRFEKIGDELQFSILRDEWKKLKND